MTTLQRDARADEPINEVYWRTQMLTIAGRAKRVIAPAVKRLPDHQRDMNVEHVSTGPTLLGLFGIADPIREEAVQAVARCQSAGIQGKMITGDHATTACAVAREFAIADSDKVLTGARRHASTASPVGRADDVAFRRMAHADGFDSVRHSSQSSTDPYFPHGHRWPAV